MVSPIQFMAPGRADQPQVDDDDRLVFGGAWAALPPIDARLASALARRFGEVVSEEELLRCGWPLEQPASPDRPPSSGALRVHLSRLRRRIARLGLDIRTVRGKGVVLLADTLVGHNRDLGLPAKRFATPLATLPG